MPPFLDIYYKQLIMVVSVKRENINEINTAFNNVLHSTNTLPFC
jgi:hypothetical protein